jgi:hypothetical protein
VLRCFEARLEREKRKRKRKRQRKLFLFRISFFFSLTGSGAYPTTPAGRGVAAESESLPLLNTARNPSRGPRHRLGFCAGAPSPGWESGKGG